MNTQKVRIKIEGRHTKREYDNLWFAAQRQWGKIREEATERGLEIPVESSMTVHFDSLSTIQKNIPGAVGYQMRYNIHVAKDISASIYRHVENLSGILLHEFWHIIQMCNPLKYPEYAFHGQWNCRIKIEEDAEQTAKKLKRKRHKKIFRKKED